MPFPVCHFKHSCYITGNVIKCFMSDHCTMTNPVLYMLSRAARCPSASEHAAARFPSMCDPRISILSATASIYSTKGQLVGINLMYQRATIFLSKCHLVSEGVLGCGSQHPSTPGLPALTPGSVTSRFPPPHPCFEVPLGDILTLYWLFRAFFPP